jgi:hypothetical protein
MRKKHASSKHPAGAKHARTKCKTHRRSKTRPENCVKSTLVQNTPPVQNTPAGAKHPCRCKTRPEKCVKQTVDAEYLDNIYLL